MYRYNGSSPCPSLTKYSPSELSSSSFSDEEGRSLFVEREGGKIKR